jgi:predicted RNase H-like nuclease
MITPSFPHPSFEAGHWLQGVDGCKGGWLRLRVRLPEERHGPVVQVEASVHPEACSLVEQAHPLPLTAIDIPIGLTERGPRACDHQARALLGGRRSSVFPAPLRPVLAAASYGEANALSRQLQGRGLSLQSFHLLAKIRQVDGLLHHRRALRPLLLETHPELCFRQWNGGTPLEHGKATAPGRLQRLTLVESLFPGEFGRIRPTLPRRAVADDDLLDAFALLRSAMRRARGQAMWLGEEELDSCELPMRIWF